MSMRASGHVVPVALAALMAACGAPSGGDSGRGMAADGSIELYHFDALPTLVATADAVVLGTVEAVRIGHVIPAEGDDFPTRFLDATIAVEQHLAGDTLSGEITVTTNELLPLELDWRQAGSRVLLFLLKDDRFLVPVSNTQGVYVVEGEDLRAVSRDEFARSFAAETLNEARGDIEKAKRGIEQGTVKPATPMVPTRGSR